jgi:uncharacterized membrane protein YfcA
MDVLLLWTLGALAGWLTTVAGLGGGMLLVLALSLLRDPVSALAATTPALLLGNVHRLYLFRRDVAWDVAAPFAVGALPGAICGAAFAAAIPSRWVLFPMTALTVMALLKAWRGWQWRFGARSLSPAGFAIGALTGTAGGAGLLIGPVFLSAGLLGVRYTASTALAAALMHGGRLIGYGAGGLFTANVLRDAGILASAIFVGNVAGKKLRVSLDERGTHALEYATLVACVALALAGF